MEPSIVRRFYQDLNDRVRLQDSYGHDVASQRAESRLCRVCADIDFSRYLGRKIESPIPLGTWDSIRQSRSCPFCRLVTRALVADKSHTPHCSDTEICLQNELSWKLGIELSPYDRSKSESYSNKFDLRSKAKQSFQDAYRLNIQFREDHSLMQIQQCSVQYLGHREKLERDRQFFGRRVLADKVDIDLLKSWLQRCSKWHEDECEKDLWPIESLPENFRLIDVKQRCIENFTGDDLPEYVALSYVWGRDAMKRETGKEPAVLERKSIVRTSDGEKTPLPKSVPRTIEDAITLTRLLGYRYLWNDALCIFQDSTFEDKVPHLNSMSRVYSCASLTIAAAAGLHADYGLPGLSLPRKVRQYSELVGGLRLASMFPSYSDLEVDYRLLWNTRGWTFQEKLLSKRLLLFTDCQVYFKCSEAIWTEEVMMESERLSKSVEARRSKYRWQPGRERHEPDEKANELKLLNPKLDIQDGLDYLGGFPDYAAAVQEYTRRDLTDPKDTLFAVSGIFETLANVTGQFVLGLPRKHFLESLLWYPAGWHVRSSTPAGRLPSWTWASYQFDSEGVSFDFMDVRQLRELISLLGRLVPRNMKEYLAYDENDNVNKTIGMIGTYSNLMACLTRPLLLKDHTIGQIYYSDGSKISRINFTLPINALILSERTGGRLFPGLINLAEKHAKSRNPSWRPTTDKLPLDRHVLAFETVIVRFRIGNPVFNTVADDSGKGDRVDTFEILNDDDECVGELRTTWERARGCRVPQHFLTVSWGFSMGYANVQDYYIPRWQFTSKTNDKESDEAIQNLIRGQLGILPLIEQVFSKCKRYVPKALEWSITPSKDGGAGAVQSSLLNKVYSAVKGEPRPRELWPVVNMILVDWDGHMARRAGVGKIMMKAWQEQSDEPQEVIFA